MFWIMNSIALTVQWIILFCMCTNNFTNGVYSSSEVSASFVTYFFARCHDNSCFLMIVSRVYRLRRCDGQTPEMASPPFERGSKHNATIRWSLQFIVFSNCRIPSYLDEDQSYWTHLGQGSLQKPTDPPCSLREPVLIVTHSHVSDTLAASQVMGRP